MEITSFKNRIILILLWILYLTIVLIGSCIITLFAILTIGSVFIKSFIILSLSIIIVIFTWIGTMNLSFMIIRKIMEY